VQDLVDAGIALVVFDFDLNIYCKHTGGSVYTPTRDLRTVILSMARDITRSFRLMVPMLHRRGIHVSIGTFGDAIDNSTCGTMTQIGGAPLIRPILRTLLGSEESALIPIFALNPDWRRETVHN